MKALGPNNEIPKLTSFTTTSLNKINLTPLNRYSFPLTVRRNQYTSRDMS